MKLHLPKLLLTAVLAACVTAPSWGEEVPFSNQQLTWSSGTAEYEGDIVRLLDGTSITMNDGTITMLKLRIHENQNANTEVFNLEAGTLNITDNDSGEGTGLKAVTIGHWGGGGKGILNISGGTLNVLNGTIRVGWDSTAEMNLSAGETNVKGIEFSEKNNNAILNMTGGRLNIGTGGIVNNGAVNANRTVTLASGTIGALNANGWTLSGITTKIGNITIDTDVVNATETTGAKISLLGELGKASADSTQSITISGSGSLIIDHAFGGDITKAENATAKLEVKTVEHCDYVGESFTGYKGSETSGFRIADYTIVVGSTNYDKVWYKGAEYDLVDGVANLTDYTTFTLDGVSFEYTADSTDIAATATGYQVLNGGSLKISSGLPNTFTSGVTLKDKGKLEIATAKPNITGGIHIADGTATIGLTGSSVSLNSSSVDMASGTRVNYVVDGATLDINQENLGTAIKSIAMSNGATAKLSNAFASLGTEQDKVAITMSGGSTLKLYNGNSWWDARRTLWTDILVDGSGVIAGSSNGNNSDVRGSISGNGVLTFNKDNNTNFMNIYSTISNGGNEGDELAINVDLTNGNVRISNANNTYSGGTTLQSGNLTVNGAYALGSGTLTINGGTLTLDSDLTVGALTKNTDAVQNLNGYTMTVTGKATGTRIEVQNGTLIINDDMSLTGNLALKNFSKKTGEGDSAVTEIIGAEIQLCGDNNEVNVLDLSNSNNSKGKVVLKEGSSTRIRNGVSAGGGALWMNSSSYIELEETASLSWGDVKVTGNDATKNGKISTTEDRNLYLGTSEATIANAKVEVSAGADTDVNNTLENVALYNNGSGKLNITGTNNTLTELHALKGSINVTKQDEIVLNALTIAKDNTLTVGTVAVGSAEAAYTTRNADLVATATLEGGATVAGNLDLSNANVLTLNGIGENSLVTVTGKFVLPIGSLTLNGNILETLAAMTSGSRLNVFSVGSFTLGRESIAADFGAEKGYTLDTVFTGHDLGSDYYLGYTAPVDGAAGMVYIGKVIPEPTTATLSLLALAGLAARRRRK